MPNDRHFLWYGTINHRLGLGDDESEVQFHPYDLVFFIRDQLIVSSISLVGPMGEVYVKLPTPTLVFDKNAQG